jgi:hypothetical protein
MAATYAVPALTAPVGLVRPGHPCRSRSSRRGDRAPAMRITRRGRLAVLTVALMVVLLPGAWRAVATAQVEGPATVAVMVQPGDTLWGIAAAMDPGSDPRALIAQIREMNALTQSGLTPGQVLVVPAG